MPACGRRWLSSAARRLAARLKDIDPHAMPDAATAAIARPLFSLRHAHRAHLNRRPSPPKHQPSADRPLSLVFLDHHRPDRCSKIRDIFISINCVMLPMARVEHSISPPSARPAAGDTDFTAAAGCVRAQMSSANKRQAVARANLLPRRIVSRHIAASALRIIELAIIDRCGKLY